MTASSVPNMPEGLDITPTGWKAMSREDRNAIIRNASIMKLDATQAHILNELRNAHDTIKQTSKHLADNAGVAAYRLAANTAGPEDLTGLTGRINHLAGVEAVRRAMELAASTFLSQGAVAKVLHGPYRNYLEGSEIVTDAYIGEDN